MQVAEQEVPLALGSTMLGCNIIAGASTTTRFTTTHCQSTGTATPTIQRLSSTLVVTHPLGELISPRVLITPVASIAALSMVPFALSANRLTSRFGTLLGRVPVEKQSKSKIDFHRFGVLIGSETKGSRSFSKQRAPGPFFFVNAIDTRTHKGFIQR